jgi:hypothetical protein
MNTRRIAWLTLVLLLGACGADERTATEDPSAAAPASPTGNAYTDNLKAQRDAAEHAAAVMEAAAERRAGDY